MNRETFVYICCQLRSRIQRVNTRMRQAISVEKRLAVTLWCLATPAEYRTIGHLFGIGEPGGPPGGPARPAFTLETPTVLDRARLVRLTGPKQTGTARLCLHVNCSCAGSRWTGTDHWCKRGIREGVATRDCIIPMFRGS